MREDGTQGSWLALVAVVLATAALYAPVRGFEFLNYDTWTHVLDKPLVQRGLSWEGLRWAFGGGHHFPPLAYVAHMADVELFGLSPGGHHLSNLGLHLLNVMLLFWALLRLTGERGPSLFVAALFALHPLDLESVVWVAQKKNLLSTTFWLAALGLHAGYARRGGVVRYASVLVCMVLGLASKPTVVTLPFVLLLLDYWPLSRLRSSADLGRLVLEKLPLFAISAWFAWFTFATQSEAGSVRSLGLLPWLPRATNAVVSYVVYLKRLVWPEGLAVLYPHLELFGLRLWSPLQVVASLCLLALISLGVWWWRRSQPHLAVGWLWYLGVLVPVIGLVQVGTQASADRYMYVPMIGPLLMLGWSGRRLGERWPRIRQGLVVCAVVAVLGAAATTRAQIEHWRDTLSLFERAIAETDDNPEALNNVAWLLATCPDGAVRDGERAVSLAESAVRLTRGRNAEFIDTLAASYAEAGRFERAALAERAAIALASRTGRRGAAKSFEERLRSYERGEPLRESRGCPGTSESGGGAPPDAQPARRSVLLITIDTLRADHVGAYGHPEPVTPAIDGLAERGVLFERAIAASSRTAPSHASIFTSRYVRDHAIGHRNGATRLRDEPTLAEQLRSAGYRTAAFVSNSLLSPRQGLDRGFETFDDELPDRERNRRYFERRAGETLAHALAWLRRAEPPWLLWVHFNDPHGPYEPPENGAPRFLGSAVGLVPEDDGALPVLRSQRGLHGIPAYQRMGSRRLPSEYRSFYASEIHRVDGAVAELVEVAREAAQDDLVLLLTSDHGESLGEQGFYFGHGHATTPELVHVPLLLLAPGLAPGRFPGLVHHVDVAPTLLELVGVPGLPGSAGVALGELWRRGGGLPERVVFADVGAELSAYRGDLFERLRIEDDLGDTREGSRVSYRWDPRHQQVVEPDPALSAALDAQAARRPDLLFADSPDLAEQRRLEALGYVEPSGEPAPDTQ